MTASSSELVAILDDDTRREEQDAASEALAGEGIEGARLVLARPGPATPRALGRALAWLGATEVYDVFAATLPTMAPRHARRFWFAVLDTPGAARGARWMALADPAESEGLNGVAMLVAIGRDCAHPARDEAVAKLARALEAAVRQRLHAGDWRDPRTRAHLVDQGGASDHLRAGLTPCVRVYV